MPRLYLFPNLLAAQGSHHDVLPLSLDQIVPSIDGLIAESEKGGRYFLKHFTFVHPKTFRDVPLRLLNEHTTAIEKAALIAEISQGISWGLVSDCGMPCLADPGADLVLLARDKGIQIETFSGPSSIILALVLSGLGGQCFTFHGYLPRENNALVQRLKDIERTSFATHSTHLCIEAPYRNQMLLETILKTLAPSTWLSIACDLTLSTQEIMTKKVQQWQRQPLPTVQKRPCVFLMRSAL